MDYPTIASFVGNTPLVRLQRLVADHGDNTVLIKLEGNNPAGSVKDRPAFVNDPSCRNCVAISSRGIH